MKTIKLMIIGALALVSAAVYAQNPAPPVVPLQDSSRMEPGKKQNTATPTPMPKTGNPTMDDSLIRDQRVPNMKTDSLKTKNKNGVNGRRKGGSGELDTTANKKRKNR
jgi:hypothetical protein